MNLKARNRTELTNRIAARLEGEGFDPQWLARLAADEALECLYGAQMVAPTACPNVADPKIVFIGRIGG